VGGQKLRASEVLRLYKKYLEIKFED
jgi:hypothetical protein